MANGDELLSPSGDDMLSGMVGNDHLSNGTGDDCCCDTCPDGKKCFQEWIASWSCPDQAWTGPVTDNRLCLPTGTDTGWVKISGDASGCEYRKYVPYDPKHCCTANGDCSGLGDTATPALPFGGGAPDDCPCEPCIEDCGCFTVGSTAVVSFAGVENSMPCIDCGGGVFFKGGSGTFGTYTLTRVAACDFEVVVGSGVSILTSDACPPAGTVITIDDGFDIELVFDGVSTWTLTVRGPEAGAFFIGTADQGDCSEPLVFTNTIVAYNPCGGHEDWTINGTATVVFTPCVPA